MATLQNISINLASKTITDTFNATSVDQILPGFKVERTILGQTFSFVVKEVTLDKTTGLYNITGTYDIAKRLNGDIDAGYLPSDAKAGDIFTRIVGGMDRDDVEYFDDFTPTGLKRKDSATNSWVCNETYSSALQKLFGWTDILPSTLINVFERGITIYAVQRGHEVGTVDITGFCGNVKFAWSQLSLLFNSSKKYYLSGDLNDANKNDSTDTSDATTYLSGQYTDDSGQQTLSYSYGLLKSDAFASTDGTITSNTTYDYSKFYPPANLLSKVTTRTEVPIVTLPTDWTTVTLPYKVVTKIVNTSTLTHTISDNGDDLVQSKETIATETSGYNVTDTQGTQEAFSETESHENTTLYSDMGQGQWSVTTYKDQKLVASQIITGNPGAKASPYSIRHNSTMQSRKGKHTKAARVELSGKFGGSMQINVSDSDTLSRIAGQIDSLNNKILEKVTLTYYGTSLIDFLNTVTYQGHVYYLESNNISETPDKGVIQQISMVRWY
jgi:hypothetical protein